MIPLLISDSALVDIQKAYDYLESEQQELGNNLLKRIEVYISFVESNPFLFKEDYKNIRQVRIKPFKYILRYKIYKDKIIFFQLFHGKLHPTKKKR